MFSMLVRFDGYYGVHAEELNTEFNLLERIRIKSAEKRAKDSRASARHPKSPR